jgi:DNA-binding transcriptional LysR family regulator
VAQSATLAGVLSAVRAGLGLALLPVASDLPAGLRELPGLPAAGDIGVHLVSKDGLPRVEATPRPPPVLGAEAGQHAVQDDTELGPGF